VLKSFEISPVFTRLTVTDCSASIDSSPFFAESSAHKGEPFTAWLTNNIRDFYLLPPTWAQGKLMALFPVTLPETNCILILEEATEINRATIYPVIWQITLPNVK
jgi:hypothetical protein